MEGQTASEQDIAALQGEWALKSCKRNGIEFRDSHCHYVFKGDTMRVCPVDKDHSLLTVRLDASCNPKELDIVAAWPNGRVDVCQAIYELSANTFRWCHSGAIRPRMFPSVSFPLGTVNEIRRVRSKASEVLDGTDSYLAMSSLSVIIGEKVERVSQDGLTEVEVNLELATWLEYNVYNGGWVQWLGNTTIEALRRTIPALAEVGCAELQPPAERVLNLAGICLLRDTDGTKESKLEQLPDFQHEQIQSLSDEFYSVQANYVARCHEYARMHRNEIT